nr:cysteine peptidase family C39 domain-containing protein [Spiroplasma sp. SV19]
MKQEQSDDCGYACLAMLIEYYHQQKLTISELKHHFQNYQGALSVYSLSQIANEYNLVLTAFEVSKQELLTLNFEQPLIAYVLNETGYYHYVVIYHRRGKRFFVADPSAEKGHWVLINDFMEKFQAVIIFTKKNKKFIYKTKTFYLSFLFLKEQIGFLLWTVFLSVVVNFLILFGKSFIKVYFDRLTTTIHQEVLIFFAIFLIIYCFRVLFSYFFQKILTQFQQKLTKKMVATFVNNLSQLSVVEFERFSTSEWLKRQGDVIILATFLGTTFPQLLFSFLMLIIGVVFLLNLNGLILTIVLLENVIIFFLSFLFLQINKFWYYRWYQQGLEFENITLELYQSFKFQKSRHLENYFNYQWTKKLAAFLVETYGFEKNNIIQKLILSFISQCATFLIFYLAISFISKQTLTIGNLMFYSALTSFINDFTTQLSGLIVEKGKLEKAFQQTVFLLFPEPQKEQQQLDLPLIKSFTITKLSYLLNDNFILKKITLTLQNHCFIKGRSGSGKTTFLEILAKLRPITSGEIMLNNQFDLAMLSEGTIRTRILLFHQDDFLFTGSVYDNILNFKQNCNYQILTLPSVKQLLKQNRLSLDQLVCNNGENLSKGQRQIILFLNLLLQSCDVYLIDEVLSNVDYESKIILLKLLFSLKSDQIIIYAGHDHIVEQFFANVIDLTKLNLMVVENE